MTISEAMERESQYLMPTYKRFPVVLESGSGATATDVEGNSYIDFGAGIGVNSLGYCDEGWVEAVCRQAGKLQHISNLYYSPIQIELAEALVTLTGMSRVFLCNSGAEANECAIKAARKYSFDKYGEGRSTILTLNNSFHGRTVTTLAATGQDGFHQYFSPFTEGFDYIPANDKDALLEKLGPSVCAVMLECIQGEGGVCPLDADYVRFAAEECKKRDVLLLIDEVQTGIGRTGTLLASEQFGVRPDVVTLAKGLAGGLPIGACLCADGLKDTMSAGMHGSTFGGNPVSCAAALYVLGRVSKPAFRTEVKEKGAYLREQLLTLPHIKEVRGMGLMLGAVLDEGFAAGEIAAKCAKEGLLVLTAKTLLRFLPPLTITKEEIDRGLAVLKTILTREDS